MIFIEALENTSPPDPIKEGERSLSTDLDHDGIEYSDQSLTGGHSRQNRKTSVFRKAKFLLCEFGQGLGKERRATIRDIRNNPAAAGQGQFP